eukprot:TRINITY_DN1070_c0_g1_i5.p1 TRINITY_DN1070_c0_g1~~TRINITY_DN1070_c0_g1_i5.p1  ORF type:complete len:518 (-),score=140.69 TRINITY_DN1070_c0_g1_i5:1651-3204(-)
MRGGDPKRRKGVIEDSDGDEEFIENDDQVEDDDGVVVYNSGEEMSDEVEDNSLKNEVKELNHDGSWHRPEPLSVYEEEQTMHEHNDNKQYLSHHSQTLNNHVHNHQHNIVNSHDPHQLIQNPNIDNKAMYSMRVPVSMDQMKPQLESQQLVYHQHQHHNHHHHHPQIVVKEDPSHHNNNGDDASLVAPNLPKPSPAGFDSEIIQPIHAELMFCSPTRNTPADLGFVSPMREPEYLNEYSLFPSPSGGPSPFYFSPGLSPSRPGGSSTPKTPSILRKRKEPPVGHLSPISKRQHLLSSTPPSKTISTSHFSPSAFLTSPGMVRSNRSFDSTDSLSPSSNNDIGAALRGSGARRKLNLDESLEDTLQHSLNSNDLTLTTETSLSTTSSSSSSSSSNIGIDHVTQDLNESYHSFMFGGTPGLHLKQINQKINQTPPSSSTSSSSSSNMESPQKIDSIYDKTMEVLKQNKSKVQHLTNRAKNLFTNPPLRGLQSDPTSPYERSKTFSRTNETAHHQPIPTT